MFNQTNFIIFAGIFQKTETSESIPVIRPS